MPQNNKCAKYLEQTLMSYWTVALLFLCFLKLSKSTTTNPVNIDINDNLPNSHLGETNSFFWSALNKQQTSDHLFRYAFLKNVNLLPNCLTNDSVCTFWCFKSSQYQVIAASSFLSLLKFESFNSTSDQRKVKVTRSSYFSQLLSGQVACYWR